MAQVQDRRTRRTGAGRRRSPLLILGTSVVLATAPIGHSRADVPASGLEGLGAPVTDEALGDMRGKFVGPGGIAYFAVELRSSWTNADGVTVSGILSMSLDQRNLSGDSRSAIPLMLIGWSRDCATCEGGAAVASSGGAPVLTAGGLGSVHGVVQSQEIRGSDNVVQNGLRISVMPASEVNATQATGLTPVTSSTSQLLPNGGAVHFVITGSQLGLSLENGNQAGLVGQNVNSGFNQVSQNVFLNSNMNTVQNSLGLTIGVDQMRQAEQVNVQNSLSVLKGLGY